jgi:surface-anchored protein
MTEDTTLTLNYKMVNGAWTPTVTRTNTTLFRSVGTGSTTDLRLQDSGADRRLRIRPAPGIYGVSDVTITITGDAGGPTQSTFQVTVVPRAVADNLLGIPGTPSTFDVLRNDTKPQPGTLVALQGFTQPAHGTLVEGSVPGTLRYTPSNGFTGNDTFTYTSIYNTGDTATATGYITVQNHLQVDAKHLDIRMNHVNGVWSNEVHAELNFGTPEAGGSSNPTILDFDEALVMANPASIMTLSGALDPSLYSFIGVPPGSSVWNLPQSSKSGVSWPGISSESIAAGTFARYTPTGDWRATAETDWIRFELVGYRIPGNAVFSMWDGGGPNGTPRVWFDSIDGINGPNETTHGTNPSDTFWTYINTHAHMNWMFTHPGRYELDVRSKALINNGGTLVEVTSPVNTLHFMVYGTGDTSTTGPLREAPPIAQNDAVTVIEDSSAIPLAVLGNDRSDPDPLEALTITAITQPLHGTSSITGGGLGLSYIPAANFNGGDSFTYTVTDEHGGMATASVAITVTAVNDPPVFKGYSFQTGRNQNATILLATLLAQASDPENDVVTLDSVTPISTARGSITLRATDLVYVPPLNGVGQDSFTATFSDSQGATSTGQVQVEVTGSPMSVNERNLVRLPNGHVQISFIGTPAAPYRIERSTDLVQWIPLAGVSIADLNGSAAFLDSEAPSDKAFYRARPSP